MNDPTQERASRQNDSTGSQLRSISEPDPFDHVCVHQEVCGLPFDNGQILLLCQLGLHCIAIQIPIGLCAWSLYCRPLATIEQAKLNPSRIRNAPHETVERVDFANQMTLSQTADCGVAGHHTNIVLRQGNQCRIRSQSGRCMRGIRTGMTAPDDQHVELAMFHVKHSLLAKAKAGKDFIQHVFDIHPPYQRIEGANSRPHFFGSDIRRLFSAGK